LLFSFKSLTMFWTDSSRSRVSKTLLLRMARYAASAALRARLCTSMRALRFFRRSLYSDRIFRSASVSVSVVLSGSFVSAGSGAGSTRLTSTPAVSTSVMPQVMSFLISASLMGEFAVMSMLLLSTKMGLSYTIPGFRSSTVIFFIFAIAYSMLMPSSFALKPALTR